MKTKILMIALCWLPIFSNMLIAQKETVSLIGRVIDKNPNTAQLGATTDGIIQSNLVALNDIGTTPTIELNLFDLNLIATQTTIDVHNNGATVWRGKIDNQQWGYVLISRVKDTYWIKIEMDNGQLFQIHPQKGNLRNKNYILKEVSSDINIDNRCEGGITPESFENQGRENKQLQNHPSVCDFDSHCSGKVVHLMVVYTNASKIDLGGAAETEAAVAMAVSEMNTINANSGVNHTFNLTHIAEVDYTEEDPNTDLSRLQSPADGFMDEVHVLRNQYGADIVSILSMSGCGLGYVNKNPTNFSAELAYNLVAPGCMTSNKSLAHEIGHNMGLFHDRYSHIKETGTLPTSACDWVWGFPNPNAAGGTFDQKWRTVMAYNDFCLDNGFGCSRIPYWSNPDINYLGDPTGIAIGQLEQANSAYMLNRAFCIVADFFPAPPCHPDLPALQALYDATNGANWATTWDINSGGCDPCDNWTGVFCNEQGRVDNLSLNNLNLNGTLPPEIGWLSELEYFSAYRTTNLHGDLPPQIRLLSSLKELNLFDNNLTGEIPQEIAQLANLEQLTLAQNSLTGAIPRKIGNLSNLKGLNLADNDLSGHLPSTFGNLAAINTILLSGNSLTGHLPKELADLENTIITILARNNDFSGCFPSEFDALCGKGIYFESDNSALQYAGDFTQFCNAPTAPCENALLCNHPDYEPLKAIFEATNGENWANNYGWLADCDPCQGIPWEGVSCTGNRVFSISLNQNLLSGTLPPEIGQLEELQYLSLVNNNLGGDIPPDIGQLANLVSLNLGINNFTSTIPNEFGQLSNLNYLLLARNNLSGPFPLSLSNAPITYFSLANNLNFSSCYPSNYSAFCGNITASFQNTMLTNFTDFCNNNTNACADDCPNNLQLSGTSQTPHTYQATETITSSATIPSVEPPDPTTPQVIYQAGTSITLEAGFHAQAGNYFVAQIVACAIFTDSAPPAVAKTKVLSTPKPKNMDLKVFPNPFTINTIIQFSLEKESPIQLQIMDATGKIVRTVLQKSTFDKGTHQINLQNDWLQSGIYFLQLTSSEGALTHKVVIQKQ